MLTEDTGYVWDDTNEPVTIGQFAAYQDRNRLKIIGFTLHGLVRVKSDDGRELTVEPRSVGIGPRV